MRYRRDGFSVESAIAKKRGLPDWYLDEPQLLIGDDFYIREFWILSTTRQLGGGGMGPISVTAIEDRGERRHGFDDQTLGLYLAVIREMDEGYLGWQRQEFERAAR